MGLWRRRVKEVESEGGKGDYGGRASGEARDIKRDGG